MAEVIKNRYEFVVLFLSLIHISCGLWLQQSPSVEWTLNMTYHHWKEK